MQKEMDGLPATLADPNADDYIPELLVVGATTARGDSLYPGNSDSGKKLPHVYAAGLGIKCPRLNYQEILNSDGYRDAYGTSPGKQKHFPFP